MIRKSGSSPVPVQSLAHSLTFTAHSSGSMAEIATRVVNELADHHLNDVVSYSPTPNDAFPPTKHRLHLNDVVAADIKTDVDDDVSDFEFAVPGIGENPSPISADEVFLNGQIKPLFPAFNTELVHADNWRRNFLPQPPSPAPAMERNSNSKPAIRMPLKKLMISERQTSLTESFSYTSSDADDLDAVAAGTYCVWNPKKNEMKKKSNSAGTSKRWNFRDFLYRSDSYRGDDLVGLASKSRSDHKKAPAERKKKEKKVTGESDRNRKTSYLTGMLAHMNGLSRAVQPF